MDDHYKECVNHFFNNIVDEKLTKYVYVNQIDLFRLVKVFPMQKNIMIT